MSNPAYPLKSYQIKNYTLTFRDGMWVVLQGNKQVFASKHEPEAKRYASSH